MFDFSDYSKYISPDTLYTIKYYWGPLNIGYITAHTLDTDLNKLKKKLHKIYCCKAIQNVNKWSALRFKYASNWKTTTNVPWKLFFFSLRLDSILNFISFRRNHICYWRVRHNRKLGRLNRNSMKSLKCHCFDVKSVKKMNNCLLVFF